MNLVTSCFDCNRGKRDKVISEIAPRPDADLAFLKVQQELVETKRYLKEKTKLDRARIKVCDSLRELWASCLTDTVPSDRVLLPWIKRYGPDEVEQSIILAAPSYVHGRFRYMDQEKAFSRLLPYVGAILRNRANADGGLEDSQCLG